MKKVIAAMMVAMMVFGLAACGSDSSTSSNTNAASNSSESDASSTMNEDSDSGSSASDEEDEVFMEPFDTSPTIEETVLWDENDVKVTATSLTYTSWSAQLNLTIENNSDAALQFLCGTAAYSTNSVNGYMVSGGYLNKTVDAGDVAEDDLSFDTEELSLYGMNQIADIEFGMKVEVDGSFSDVFYLTPKKIETTTAASYDYETDTYAGVLESGMLGRISGYDTNYCSLDELYNSNGISMDSVILMSQLDEGDDDTEEDDEEILLMMEMSNQSDYTIYAQITNVGVNGTEVYSSTWSYNIMLPGKRAVLDIDMDYLIGRSDDTAINTLTADDIDTITFTLHILNEDYEEALSPEEITINVK